MRPSLLLDPAVEPPAGVAEKVLALRALVRSGGCTTPLSGQIVSSQGVADWCRPRLGADSMESIWVVGLDARNRVRFERCVSRGGISACAVSPGDIIRPLVLNACLAGVIVHNHPSGDPTPSPEDIALTQRVHQGGELLGVRLLDHVIVAAEGYFSFLDAGLVVAPY